MSHGMEHTDVSWDRFDVEVSYKCPICGETTYCSFEPNDVYWAIEGGVEVECANCGSPLLAFD